MADTPTGITAVFGTSGFSASISAVNLNGMERPAIDVTHLGSTTYREFIPGDLSNPGQVEMTFWFDPDAQPPIGGAVETLTITWPLPTGGITAATLAGTGFTTSWSADASGGDESAMSGEMTFQFDGGTGPTWTAST